MISESGTNGIAHSIHVADVTDDGGLTNFREFENVLDAMNLPDGTVKFNYEDGLKEIQDGRIVRSTVKGVSDAYRYRCTSCKIPSTDVITQQDRGNSMRLDCLVCEQETTHSRRGMDEL